MSSEPTTARARLLWIALGLVLVFVAVRAIVGADGAVEVVTADGTAQTASEESELDALADRAIDSAPGRSEVVAPAPRAAHTPQPDDPNDVATSLLVGRSVAVEGIPGVRSGRCEVRARFYDSPIASADPVYFARIGMDHFGTVNFAFEASEAARRGAEFFELDLGVPLPVNSVSLVDNAQWRRRWSIDGGPLSLQPAQPLVGVCFLDEHGSVRWTKPVRLLASQRGRVELDATGWLCFTEDDFASRTELILYTDFRSSIVPTKLYPPDERGLVCIPYDEFGVFDRVLVVRGDAVIPESMEIGLQREMDGSFVSIGDRNRRVHYEVERESRSWTFRNLPPGIYRASLRGKDGAVAGERLTNTVDLREAKEGEIRFTTPAYHSALSVRVRFPDSIARSSDQWWGIVLDPGPGSRNTLQFEGDRLDFAWLGPRPTRAIIAGRDVPRHPSEFEIRWTSETVGVIDLSKETLRTCVFVAPDGSSNFTVSVLDELSRGLQSSDQVWRVSTEGGAWRLSWWQGAEFRLPVMRAEWPGGTAVLPFEMFDTIDSSRITDEERIVLEPLLGRGTTLRIEGTGRCAVWAWLGAADPDEATQRRIAQGDASTGDVLELRILSKEGERTLDAPPQVTGLVFQDFRTNQIAYAPSTMWNVASLNLEELDWR